MMADRSMADCIEDYLKEILRDVDQVELKRSDIATRFNVVPSEINYVIKTRFTLQNGYLVESKRGGGGYIRISKVTVGPDAHFIEALLQDLPSQVQGLNRLMIDSTCLTREHVLTEQEKCLVQTLLSKETLEVLAMQDAQAQLRARLFRQLLNRLRFESER